MDDLSEKYLKKILSIPLFEGTERNLLCRVFSEHHVQIRSFSGGELLHSPEDLKTKAGILLSGRATVTTPDPVHAVLLRFMGPGDVFGIANLFSDEPYVSRIISNGGCKCVFLSEDTIAELLNSSDRFRKQYIEFLTGRIRFLNRKIGYLTAGSAEQRLSLYLSSFGTNEMILKDSITSLSDLLNLGRASIYRAFDRLQKDGYLIREGKKIVLLDPDSMLRAYQ